MYLRKTLDGKEGTEKRGQISILTFSMLQMLLDVPDTFTETCTCLHTINSHVLSRGLPASL